MARIIHGPPRLTQRAPHKPEALARNARPWSPSLALRACVGLSDKALSYSQKATTMSDQPSFDSAGFASRRAAMATSRLVRAMAGLECVASRRRLPRPRNPARRRRPLRRPARSTSAPSRERRRRNGRHRGDPAGLGRGGPRRRRDRVSADGPIPAQRNARHSPRGDARRGFGPPRRGPSSSAIPPIPKPRRD